MEQVELADHRGVHGKKAEAPEGYCVPNPGAFELRPVDLYSFLAAVLFRNHLSNLLTCLLVVSKCVGTRYFMTS